MHSPMNVKFGSYESGVLTEISCLIKMCLNESSVQSAPFYKFVGFVACTEIVKQGCIKNVFYFLGPYFRSGYRRFIRPYVTCPAVSQRT
jgi:hypothetical protein